MHLENGAINGNPMIYLINSSHQAFILAGNTSGGPPTTYTWMRDGAEISNNETFSISIAVNRQDQFAYQNSSYRSTLTVTGRQAGVYQYSLTNRATASMMTGSFTVQGMLKFPQDFYEPALESRILNVSEHKN